MGGMIPERGSEEWVSQSTGVAAQNRWYSRKRFMIPLGFLSLVVGRSLLVPRTSPNGAAIDAGALSVAESETLIAGSDDEDVYRTEFATAARDLITEGRCTAEDFREMGGWTKSVVDHKDEPVYFTYCGGMTISNKIYLNAGTGRIL